MEQTSLISFALTHNYAYMHANNRAFHSIFMSHMHISDTWRSRWVESKHKSDYGKFVLSAGKFYGDAEKDKGECWFIYYRHQIIDTGLFEFVVSSVLHYIMLWIIRQGRGYCLWLSFPLLYWAAGMLHHLIFTVSKHYKATCNVGPSYPGTD